MLDSFAAGGMEFAVLHRYHAVLAGDVGSDVDIVVGSPPPRALLSVRDEVAAIGLGPIVAWPYDVGGTMSLFLSTGEAGEGVQVDMLHDPGGRGRYGVRSSELLARADRSGRWPRIHPTDELTYLASKRLRKGQTEELKEIVAGIRSEARDDVESSIGSILSPAAADELRHLLAGRHTSRSRAAMGWPELSRLGHRLSKPIGHWIHLAHAEEAADLAKRLLRFLPVVRSGPYPGPSSLWWWGTRVVPVRWRPGVFVSWGHRQPRLADVVPRPGTSSLASAVTGMQTRVWAQLGAPLR